MGLTVAVAPPLRSCVLAMLTHPEEDSVSSTLIYSRVGHSAGKDLAHPLSPGVPTLLHVVACYACIVCRMDWGVDYKDHCLNALRPVRGGFLGACLYGPYRAVSLERSSCTTTWHCLT